MDGTVLVVTLRVGFVVEIDFGQARWDPFLCGSTLFVDYGGSKGCLFYIGGVGVY